MTDDERRLAVREVDVSEDAIDLGTVAPNRSRATARLPDDPPDRTLQPRRRKRFGDVVAGIVRDCTDGSAESKGAASTPEAKRRDGQQRKEAYLQHLAEESEASLLVGACDTLHNAWAIVADLENPAIGVVVFDRFTAGRDGTL